MNYRIDPSAREAAYLQLYRALVTDITGAVYPFGARLPSKRVLAAETGVSVITAGHAIQLLCDEGYAECRERSGCFVIYRERDFLPSAAPTFQPESRPASPVLPANSFPFSVLARTMRKVLQDRSESILIKSPNHGCDVLREEIRAYLARSRGIQVSPEQIIIGSGAEYLYGLIAQLLGTDSIYALEDPCYEKIRRVYTSMGIRCESLPLTMDGIPSAALRRTKAAVLHVTPFNSYPSLISADISKKLEYIRWARERGATLIEDNYDSELTVSGKPEDTLFSLAGGRQVLYVNTFSHTIAPSIRIGYLLLPQELVRPFHDQLGFYSCTVPVFDQYVLAELLRSGDFERHINRIRRQKRKNARETT